MLPALCGYHAHFEWTSGIHFVPFGVFFAVIAQLVFIRWFWSFTVRFWLKNKKNKSLSPLENNFFGKCRECPIGTYLHCLLTVHWKGRSVTNCSTREIWFPVTAFYFFSDVASCPVINKTWFLTQYNFFSLSLSLSVRYCLQCVIFIFRFCFFVVVPKWH